MTADTFISWLIHSDWFMIAAWIVLLGAALAMTVADWPLRAHEPVNRDLPPRP